MVLPMPKQNKIQPTYISTNQIVRRITQRRKERNDLLSMAKHLSKLIYGAGNAQRRRKSVYKPTNKTKKDIRGLLSKTAKRHQTKPTPSTTAAIFFSNTEEEGNKCPPPPQTTKRRRLLTLSISSSDKLSNET